MGIDIRALAITGLLAFAIYFTYGQFSLPWMTVLPIVFALAILRLPISRKLNEILPAVSLGLILFFIATGAASLLPEEPLRSVIIDVARQDLLPMMRALFVIAGALIVALFLNARSLRYQKWSMWIFAAILVVLAAAYSLIIPTSPNPQIDVWTLHEQAADAFVHFHNPYTMDYINIYPKELWPTLTPFGVNFAYLPGVFMWMSLSKIFGLDTRYSQVFAHILTAIFLVLIAAQAQSRRSFATYVPALLFITFPMTTFFIVRGWNDDISVLFFAFAAYAICARRSGLLFVACNALFLSKQYAILFVPFFIWFAVRNLRKGVIESIVKSTIGAAIICGAYTVYDWRNFLGSLYGLHFLKHPEIHQVFPDRTDPYSLMNYLHLYGGLKSAWLFAVIVVAIATRVIVINRRELFAPALLRGLAAMSLGMVIFAPVAFANYYEYAFGLLLVGCAASLGTRSLGEIENPARGNWELKSSWWTVGYIGVRALILFCFGILIIETRAGAEVAQMVSAGRTPYFDFSFPHLPFALVPDLVSAWLQRIGDKKEFIAYHTLFQLVVLMFDVALAVLVFRRRQYDRISKLTLGTYVFGPLFLAPMYLTSPTLVSVVSVVLIANLVSRLPLAQRLGQWCLAHRKLVFMSSLAVATLSLGVFVVLWLNDFELNIDAFLFPTHILIIGLALAPFVPRLKTPQSRRWTKWVLGLSVALTLGLTSFLIFNIEAVLRPQSELSNFVWIRNSLLGFSAIIMVWIFYRARITAREV